jgi:hypothetical protein
MAGPMGSMFGTSAGGAVAGPAKPADPNDTNYGGSGMSRTAYYAKYGDPNQQGAAARSAAAGASAQGTAAANNPAINPTLSNSTVPGSVGGPINTLGQNGATPQYGTESGPGILDQWFNQRATGTDPGYEYTTGRGLKALDSQYAARGGYNSGAALQGGSDYLANMGAQREGQLDQLAAGASGERAGQLSTMLGLGMGLTGGLSGLGSAYDLGAGNALSSGNATSLQLGTNAAMLPYQANSNLMSQGLGLAALGLL